MPCSISSSRSLRASEKRMPRMPASFAPAMFIALSSMNTLLSALMPNSSRAFS